MKIKTASTQVHYFLNYVCVFFQLLYFRITNWLSELKKNLLKNLRIPLIGVSLLLQTKNRLTGIKNEFVKVNSHQSLPKLNSQSKYNFLV